MKTLVLLCLAFCASGQTLQEMIRKEAEAMEQKLIETRRDIHMHPELSNQEVRTGKLIAERLRALGFDEVKPGVAGNGVVGVLKGSKPGPVVAWRADMDALPIDESTFPVGLQEHGQRSEARLRP